MTSRPSPRRCAGSVRSRSSTDTRPSGRFPVDVRALGIDIYIGGCLKWLCGGPGAAFLWVDPGHRVHLEPRLTGWMAHERPFAFQPKLVRREDAWRFLHGTPSIPALYAARPGLEIVREAGIEAIRTKSIRQTQRLLDLADEGGLSLYEPPRPVSEGRYGRDRRGEWLRDLPEPQVPRHPLRLPARGGNPILTALLHPRRRARRGGRSHR